MDITPAARTVFHIAKRDQVPSASSESATPFRLVLPYSLTVQEPSLVKESTSFQLRGSARSG